MSNERTPLAFEKAQKYHGEYTFPITPEDKGLFSGKCTKCCPHNDADIHSQCDCACWCDFTVDWNVQRVDPHEYTPPYSPRRPGSPQRSDMEVDQPRTQPPSPGTPTSPPITDPIDVPPPKHDWLPKSSSATKLRRGTMSAFFSALMWEVLELPKDEALEIMCKRFPGVGKRSVKNCLEEVVEIFKKGLVLQEHRTGYRWLVTTRQHQAFIRDGQNVGGGFKIALDPVVTIGGPAQAKDEYLDRMYGDIPGGIPNPKLKIFPEIALTEEERVALSQSVPASERPLKKYRLKDPTDDWFINPGDFDF